MGPHQGQPVARRGPAPAEARAALIMIHGRNAGPANILELAGPLHRPDFTFLAPAAAGGTWYPYSFLSEIERNQPGISSGLAAIGALVSDTEQAGVPRARIILLGFSQGACLAGQFVVEHGEGLGGLAMLSGGLIGPPGTVWQAPTPLTGLPVFLGCSDVDAHIPKQRVEESAAVFERLGARVTTRIYPGMGHQVVEDELAVVRDMMASTVNGKR